MTDDAFDAMKILVGALPFLRRYDDQIVVVKYGGHAMGEEETALRFGRDIALLEQVGVSPVVVHGGGPQINAMLKRLNVQSTFVQGLRVTDSAMLDVVEMVLAGPVNKQVAQAITRAGALAVGISGKDGGLIKARKVTRTVRDPGSKIEQVLDLGFVGEPTEVDTKVLRLLIGADCNYYDERGIDGLKGSAILYPQPADESITIHLANPKSCQFTVYNLQGKQLKQGQFSGTDYSLNV